MNSPEYFGIGVVQNLVQTSKIITGAFALKYPALMGTSYLFLLVTGQNNNYVVHVTSPWVEKYILF